MHPLGSNPKRPGRQPVTAHRARDHSCLIRLDTFRSARAWPSGPWMPGMTWSRVRTESAGDPFWVNCSQLPPPVSVQARGLNRLLSTVFNRTGMVLDRHLRQPVWGSAQGADLRKRSGEARVEVLLVASAGARELLRIRKLGLSSPLVASGLCGRRLPLSCRSCSLTLGQHGLQHPHTFKGKDRRYD